MRKRAFSMKQAAGRFMTLALSVACILQAAPVNALAAGPSDPKYVSTYTGNADDEANLAAVVQRIGEGMLAHQASIEVGDLIAYDDLSLKINAILAMVKAKYPELFYWNLVLGRSESYNGSQTFVTVHPSYKSEFDDNWQTKLAEFYDAADFYLDQVRGELDVCQDEFSKALILHDEMILDVQYACEVVDNKILAKSGTTNYGLLVGANGVKEGVCDNYARVYAYLLGQVGIYSEFVESSSMNHAWNKVRLDGNWYHVDVTWDDPTLDKPGRVQHWYFLLSDTEILKEISGQGTSHYGYQSIHASNDTRYDAKQYHNFSSKLCKLEDGTTVYGVDGSGKQIVSYNYVTDKATKVKDLSSVAWSAGENSYWNGVFSGLAVYDGKLYYNTPNDIRTFDPATPNDEVIVYTKKDTDPDIYGLRIRGNKLYAVFAESAIVSGTETEVLTLTASTDVRDIVNGASLTLEGDIGVNFYVTLDDASAAMTFVMNGPDGEKRVDVASLSKLTEGDYVGAYKVSYQVAPSDMDQNIVFSLENANGEKLMIYRPAGTAYDGRQITYSVKKYVEKAKNLGTDHAKLATLCEKLDVYGLFCKKQFVDETLSIDDSVIAALPDITKEALFADGRALDFNGTLPGVMTFKGSTLLLNAKTSYRLYFDITDTTGLSATVNGQPATIKHNSLGYYVQLSNIDAADLDTNYVAVVTDGTNSCTITFSALTYVYCTLKNETSAANIYQLVKALYAYNQAANAYFNH